MPDTAASLIKSALQEILVQADESALTASEQQDAITYLNRMMAKFAAQGINLGYTQVSDLGDDITVPEGALDGIVKNLAITLQPQYAAPGTSLSQLLFQQAAEGLQVMRMIAIEAIGPTFYPNTMPIGSGNEINNGFTSEHFYNEPAEQVETESGGYISVESETETDP